MRIVTSEEMQAIDQKAIDAIGIPSLILMENAGLEAAKLVSEIFHTRTNGSRNAGEILIFAGKGKNGGDGLVVARRLLASNYRLRVFLLHPESEYRGEAATHLKILKQMRARITVVDSPATVEEYFKSAQAPYIVVDALLGTGLKGKIEGIYYDVIQLLNANADALIALDIPSGVQGSTGDLAGSSVLATDTITFGYPKRGHFLTPGASRRGNLHVVDLTFPPTWAKEGSTFLLTHENTAPLLQTRDKFGHKNSFGHCLLIGGSPGRVGAVVMASNSCLKMGTGLVTVASWEESFPALESKLSAEIMNFRIVKEGNDYVVPKPGLQAFSSIVVGPGLGQRADGAELLSQLLLKYPGPMVIDADGLNIIAENNLYDLVAKRRKPTVLTPHPGEMARLLNKPKEQILADPIASVREAAELLGSIVLLKGATTLIQTEDNVTWFNHYPNDGMATAGSGDVLAGIIGGLLGQHMDPSEATRLGVYLHSLSGKMAAEVSGHRSMTATDLIENLKHAFLELRDHNSNDISLPTRPVV